MDSATSDPGIGFRERFGTFGSRARRWSAFAVTVAIVLLALLADGAATAATVLERGPDDFRISWMGPNGDTAYGAFWFLLPNMAPDVAYNPVSDEYLVVWYADDNTAPLVDEEFEIYGQRVDAATGALVGGRVRISHMGPDGDPEYDALLPAVTYNSVDNEYMVVWVGDHNQLPLVNDEFEIFGRRVSAGGQLLGSQSRISQMGPPGDPNYGPPWWIRPDVAHNATDNVYMIVWCADSDQAPFVDNEFEIFGRRFYATLTPVDGAHYSISVMGPQGNPSYSASQPAVTWDSTHNDFFVVWEGDSNAGGLIDNEFEIFGQSIPADPGVSFWITFNIQISMMGGANGDSVYDAYDPDVAYNSSFDNFFVTWVGDDNSWPTADEEFEVWGRLVAWDGTLIAGQYRVSSMGWNDGDTAFSAHSPAVVSGPDSYHVVWHADDDTFGMVDDEFEVFTTEVWADPLVFGLLGQERLTTMGANGDPSRGAFVPGMAFDSSRSGGLVVWWGDDNASPSVDDEFEIFGQLVAFPRIFGDGFESGGTGGWSGSFP